MKHLFTLMLIGMASIGMAQAQSICDDGRFSDRNYFDADSIVKDSLVFGSNIPVGQITYEDLYMDIYHVPSDTLSERPVVMLAFGGSFLYGSRADVEGLCRSFAEMGYLAIAIDYRVGPFFPVNERSTTLAVLRGLHDMKAAVRYLYKDRATTNELKVDTNRIIIGGVSAGAITAIHTAYLDKLTEIPSYFTTGDTAGLGGIEGNSGNLGYSSKVAGVISYSGTIGDTSWIEAGDAPIIMMHDSLDGTVPFGTDTIRVQSISTHLEADGSSSMRYRLDHLGIDYQLRVFPGSGHVSYVRAADIDSVLNQTMSYIETYACRDLNTGINNINALNNAISIYPNPSNGVFTVDLGDSQEATIEVYDLLGQLVTEVNASNDRTKIDLTTKGTGIYVVYVKDAVTGKALSVNKLLVNR